MKKRALLSTALLLATFGMTANVAVQAEESSADAAVVTSETANVADSETIAAATAAAKSEPVAADSPQVKKLIAAYPNLVARIQPYGRVCFEGEDCDINITVMAAAVDGQARDGKTIYDGVCHTCHATGLVGAPKLGVVGDWASRINKGKTTLYHNAINGINAMPAKGGADISDEEVQNAVDYMVEQSS